MKNDILRFFFYLILCAIALLGLAFAALNAKPVLLSYFAGESYFSLSTLLLCALCLGAVLGMSTTVLILLKLKHENASLRDKMRHTEKELQVLRMMPMKDMS